MLNLSRMRRIKLSGRPLFQQGVGRALLMPNYYLPPRVTIELQNADRVPSEPVIFAMNHTDRYNYWPFQFRLWRQLDRFTCTWVKGKYYENPILGKFMELTNNIPTVSRGYIVARDFMSAVGRSPSSDEYTVLRRWVDGAARGEIEGRPAEVDETVPAAVLEKPREMLGRFFDPAKETYAACVAALFDEMMRCFVELNQVGRSLDLDLLVFPQGTRSIRLSRGHPGLAQIALHQRRTIVPVGCNGSDKVYPGNSPWARGGRIVFRIGEPIRYDSLRRFHVSDDFEPFAPASEKRYGDKLQGLADHVMEAINELLDPPYQFSTDRESDGVGGARRFV